MTEVLRKVAEALRPDGIVLIIQPSKENPIVEVIIDGKVEFREVTDEQNFRGYLKATERAIQRSVGENVFEVECEASLPAGDNYNCNEYDSLNDWVEDRSSFCEDVEVFNAMAARIQSLVGGRRHNVLEYWREYKILLRKSVR
jgi:hypothetical protein